MPGVLMSCAHARMARSEHPRSQLADTHQKPMKQTFPHLAEDLGLTAPALLSCVGFGWYEGRAMGQRKGEWVQSQVGEEVLMER